VTPLTVFEANVLSAPSAYRARSASTLARDLYGSRTAHRYMGAVGRALQRLAARHLVAFRGEGWQRSTLA